MMPKLPDSGESGRTIYFGCNLSVVLMLT